MAIVQRKMEPISTPFDFSSSDSGSERTLISLALLIITSSVRFSSTSPRYFVISMSKKTARHSERASAVRSSFLSVDSEGCCAVSASSGPAARDPARDVGALAAACRAAS